MEKRSGHSDPFLRERERQVMILLYCIIIISIGFHSEASSVTRGACSKIRYCSRDF
jgi:hypothetical protein